MKQTLDLQKSTLAHRPSFERQNFIFPLIYLHLFLPFFWFTYLGKKKQNLAIGHGSVGDGQSSHQGYGWINVPLSQ